MNEILLIEDDATMRSLLKTLIELDGQNHVTVVANPKVELLQSLQNIKPTLVIMDVHLKDANGIELLKQIRQLNLSWRPKVILSSGMDLKTECLQAGADGFLMKPYMPDDLFRYLKNI